MGDRKIAIVFRPEEEAPEWAEVEDCVFWGMDGETLSEDPEIPPSDRIPVKLLLDAAQRAVDSMDCTGCTPDLAVVESAPMHELASLLRLLRSSY